MARAATRSLLSQRSFLANSSLPSRWLAIGISLITGLLTAVACSLIPSNQPPTTLVIWVSDPSFGASISQRLQPFLHDHPNLQVKVFDQAGRILSGDVSLAIEALAGTEKAPDVIAITDLEFQLMSNPDDLLNLSPYVMEQSNFQSEDFFPSVLDAFRLQGRQYAIPSDVVPWMIFYNEQLFDQAGLSYPSMNWSTSEFVADAQQVQARRAGNGEVAGFVTDSGVALLPAISIFGAVPKDIKDDPDVSWLADPRAARGLDWLAGLALRDKIMPIDSQNRSEALWAMGRAAMGGMFMDQRNLLPAFMQRSSASLTPTPTGRAAASGWNFPWGVTMMPKAEIQSTVYFVAGYAIPATSHDPDNAWLLIDYLTRNLPESPGRAYVPSRMSLAHSAKFASLYPEEGREAYIRSVQLGQRIPVLPLAAYASFADLQNVFTGTASSSEALHTFQDHVRSLATTSPASSTPAPSGQ